MKKYMGFAFSTAAALVASAAIAMPLPPVPDAGEPIVQARGGYHGGYHGGYRGGYGGRYVGAYRPPGGYYGRPVVRPPAYVAWRRPYYGWRPGGAIAAGAAIGVLSAATAAAYASSAAPAQGLCWYYTDPSYQSGFWDNCP